MKFIIDTGRDRLEFPLVEGTAFVGRDPTCEVQLDHAKVSRRHLECRVEAGKVTVQDLGSKNGTFVNDVQIQETTLRHGDVVKVGGAIALTFDQSGIADAPTVAVAPGRIQNQPQRPTATTPADAAGEPPAQEPASDVDRDEEPTPEDDNMLPAQYAAGQQTDARLVKRGGRLYAQDPVTGQEVEIVPVGKEKDATPGKRSLRDRLASMRPVHKVSIGLCIFLLLLAVIAKLRKPPPAKPKGTVMSRRQYDKAIDDAISRLDANDIRGAERILTSAQKALPKRKVAEMILDVCQIWVDLHGKGFLETRDEAEERFGEIADSEYASVKVRTFAKKQLLWLQTENRHEGILFAAEQYVKKKEWEEAFAQYARLPKDSLFYAKVKKRVLEVQQTIVTASLEEAEKAVGEQKWEEAVDAYLKAKRYDPEIPDVDKKIQTCQWNAADRDRLKKAEEARDEKEWDQVSMHVQAIRPDGPYGAQAAELRKLVKTKSVYVDAQGLYNQGDSDQALARLKGLTSADAVSLRQRIEQVVRYLQLGDSAAKQQRFQEAQGYWQDVLRLEKNESNHYRSKAARAIANWKTKAKDLAYQLVKDGTGKFGQKNYAEARRLYGEAIKMDPEGKAGQAQIDALIKQAEQHLWKGIACRDKDPQKALRHFETAKQMTVPGEGQYQRAVSEIDRLKAKGP